MRAFAALHKLLVDRVILPATERETRWGRPMLNELLREHIHRIQIHATTILLLSLISFSLFSETRLVTAEEQATDYLRKTLLLYDTVHTVPPSRAHELYETEAPAFVDYLRENNLIEADGDAIPPFGWDYMSVSTVSNSAADDREQEPPGVPGDGATSNRSDTAGGISDDAPGSMGIGSPRTPTPDADLVPLDPEFLFQGAASVQEVLDYMKRARDILEKADGRIRFEIESGAYLVPDVPALRGAIARYRAEHAVPSSARLTDIWPQNRAQPLSESDALVYNLLISFDGFSAPDGVPTTVAVVSTVISTPNQLSLDEISANTSLTGEFPSETVLAGHIKLSEPEHLSPIAPDPSAAIEEVLSDAAKQVDRFELFGVTVSRRSAIMISPLIVFGVFCACMAHFGSIRDLLPKRVREGDADAPYLDALLVLRRDSMGDLSTIVFLALPLLSILAASRAELYLTRPPLSFLDALRVAWHLTLSSASLIVAFQIWRQIHAVRTLYRALRAEDTGNDGAGGGTHVDIVVNQQMTQIISE